MPMNWSAFIRKIENLESELIKSTHEILDLIPGLDEQVEGPEVMVLETICDARAALQDTIKEAKKLAYSSGFTAKEPSA